MVRRKGLTAHVGTILIHVIIILMGLICLLPLLNIAAISFSGNAAVAGNQVGLIPVDFTAAAYKKLVEDSQFWRSAGTSVLRVALQLVFNMVLVVLMAYPLSKSPREFRARGIYMKLLIFAMLFNGGLIPSYLVVKKLGLINTIWALILPGAVPIFNVILVMNFFAAVPKSLEEAAAIDGAGPMDVLMKVYLPCSKPVLATVALYSVVGSWNDFFGGLIYITRVARYPLMTYIQSLNVNIAELVSSGADAATLAGIAEISNKNLNAAKIVVSTIPLLLIYPFLQKYFVTGIVMGAVKE